MMDLLLVFWYDQTLEHCKNVIDQITERGIRRENEHAYEEIYQDLSRMQDSPSPQNKAKAYKLYDHMYKRLNGRR